MIRGIVTFIVKSSWSLVMWLWIDLVERVVLIFSPVWERLCLLR